MCDTDLLQDEKEIAAIADALASFIDEYLSLDRLNLFDDAPTLRAAEQEAPNASFWLLPDTDGVLANNLAAQNLVIRTVAQVWHMTFAAMDDADSSFTGVGQCFSGEGQRIGRV